MSKKDRFSINGNLNIIRRGKKGIWTADFNVGYSHRRVSLKTTDQATAIRIAEKMSLDLAKGELKEINAKFPLDEASLKVMVAAIDLLQINYQAFNPCENVLNPEALRSLAKVTLNHQPKIVEKLKLTSKKSFININLSKYINY